MNKTNRILPHIFSLCILGTAIYFTISRISPPAPLPINAPLTEFSTGRAMQDRHSYMLFGGKVS